MQRTTCVNVHAGVWCHRDPRCHSQVQHSPHRASSPYCCLTPASPARHPNLTSQAYLYMLRGISHRRSPATTPSIHKCYRARARTRHRRASLADHAGRGHAIIAALGAEPSLLWQNRARASLPARSMPLSKPDDPQQGSLCCLTPRPARTGDPSLSHMGSHHHPSCLRHTRITVYFGQPA